MPVSSALNLAAGIRRVKGMRRLGVRLGHWLTAEQGRPGPRAGVSVPSFGSSDNYTRTLPLLREFPPRPTPPPTPLRHDSAQFSTTQHHSMTRNPLGIGRSRNVPEPLAELQNLHPRFKSGRRLQSILGP
jgi:hypothetical protein